MTIRSSGILAGLMLGMIAAVVFAHPAHAGYDISCWNRSQASDYGFRAIHEGYEWGGGWWNDNNKHDTGEGPDCSGLVFKTWAMKNAAGDKGYYYWYEGDNIHGPYSSTAFRDGCSGACFDVCGGGTGSSCGAGSYGSTERMDGFASSGHIGLIWNEGSNGYDDVLEALNESSGVNVWSRNYRTNAAYDVVRRAAWRQ
jgi:hypothetical protein